MLKKVTLPRIFMSFSSRDYYWLASFWNDRSFWPNLGNVERAIYNEGDNINFGKLDTWVSEQVDSASVVIAFVSRNYIDSKWSGVEWDRALEAQKSGNLLFIAVMLDAYAKESWKQARYSGGLEQLPIDEAYADFSDGNGPMEITPDSKPHARISKFAQAVRSELDRAERRRKPKENSGIGPGPALGVPQVVVLGHPDVTFSDELAGDTCALQAALSANGLAVQHLPDAWSKPGYLHIDQIIRGAQGAAFVQPLCVIDASYHVKNNRMTEDRLAKFDIKSPLVTLWLPNRYDYDDFSKAAVEAQQGEWPALRTDTPDELAKWLSGLLKPKADDKLVLQIESVASDDSLAADEDALQLHRFLESSFKEVVEDVHPEPAAWRFDTDKQVIRQVEILPATRSVFAVHNFSVSNPTAKPQVSHQIFTEKLSGWRRQVEQGLKGRVGASPLKVFKAVLVVRKPEDAPFDEWPEGPEADRWNVLRYEPVRSHATLGQLPKVDPASLREFRSRLVAWATT